MRPVRLGAVAAEVASGKLACRRVALHEQRAPDPHRAAVHGALELAIVA